MATLIRSSKSGSSWSRNELFAFNIVVIPVDTVTFFGSEQLPPPSIPNSILINEIPSGQLTKDETNFFKYLALANSNNEESAVDDFATHLLRLMNYDDGGWLLRTKKEMGFYMGGQMVDAKADVSIMNGQYYILVAQEDKRFGTLEDPEAQVIAECIAAFAYNQMLRQKTPGAAQVKSETISAITMVGTTATFYRVNVTQSLLDSLVTLSYPAEETVVMRYMPPVPEPQRYPDEGMAPLGNRCVVLQCFEAFKQSMAMSTGGSS
ncbi:hypothetical protein HGRIS_013999 [Hohenbuehelia grisea]|uniref:Uncharacterized protein n=1 Tax=Hohenbuehelia grisea TaxID=104357 RepID=A0ABR3JU69_9AGAR